MTYYIFELSSDDDQLPEITSLPTTDQLPKTAEAYNGDDEFYQEIAKTHNIFFDDEIVYLQPKE